MAKFLILGAGFLGLGTYAFYQSGAFQHFEIQREIYPGGHLVYYDYQGGALRTGLKIREVMPQLSRLLNQPGAHGLCIFLDDPSKIADRSKARVIIGVVVPAILQPSQLEGKYDPKKFKVTELPQVKTVRTFWPYIPFLSCFTMYWRAHPALEQYLQNNRIASDQELGPLLDVHFMKKNSEHVMEVHRIYGENREKYEISQHPKPKSK